jgi:ParB-like chromosome segregation protein Spo0J
VREVSDVLEKAQAEGRMIQALPLDSIVSDHLVRDRMGSDPEEMQALKQSLEARGQQTPIEVTSLPLAADGRTRFGLISGWRRLQALRALSEETGEERFDTVLALLRQPRDQAEAYVAMVEENEIRANLSFFERARIVLKALNSGVFETEKQALQSLFSSASYPKRSKIKSFLPVVSALDGELRFPAQMTERTGLTLSKALADEPAVIDRIIEALRQEVPDTPDAETQVLLAAVAGRKKGSDPRNRDTTISELAPGIRMKSAEGKIQISGSAVTSELCADLTRWLLERGRD